MPATDQRLRNEIYAIVLIKLVVIFALWWAFIRDARIDVDSQRLSEHLSTPVPVASSARPTGDPHAQ